MLRQKTWTFANPVDIGPAHIHIDTVLAPGKAIWLTNDSVELTGAPGSLEDWIRAHGGVRA